MVNLNKWFGLFVKSLLFVVVFTFGLVSIIATQSSSGDDPAEFFANAGRDQSVETAGDWVQLDGTGSDTPPNGIMTDEKPIYLWSVISSPPKPEFFPFPETYVLENANTIKPRLRPIVEGEYAVQLHIRFGRFQAWDNVSVFAYDGPVPANARVGADRFVKHGTLVRLDGSDSYSNFEDRSQSLDLPFRFNWFMNQRPAGTTSELSSSDSVNPAFIAEYNPDDVNGDRPQYSLYETRLQVINDRDQTSTPVHVKTYVFPAEGFVYPIPIVGPDQKVITGTTVQLDGSDSYDIDGRSLNFDWLFFSRPAGSNAALNGADTDTPSFVADRDGTYVIQLQVSNEELSSIRRGPLSENYRQWGSLDYAGTDRVVITAFTGSAISVTDSGEDQLLPFNGAVAVPLDGSGSYDIDGDQITYRWYLMNAPQGSVATIDTPVDTQPGTASLLADMAGTYLVGLNTDVLHQGDYQNDHVLITLTENNMPVANAGIDKAVSVGDTVILDASASSDADGDSLGYSWSLAAAPGDWGFENVAGIATWHDWPALSDGSAVAPAFTPDLNGEYRLLLTVNDGQQSSIADEVIITAAGSAVNTAPIANAGTDQSISVGATAMLDGSASSDAENDTLSFNWTLEIRPLTSNAVIVNPTSETASLIADVEGSYSVQLVVNDGLLNSSPDTMTVTATAVSGFCPQPLDLVTTLPFAPNLGEVPTDIHIDAAGANTVSAVGTDTPVDSIAYQARIPDGSNPDQAEFVLILPAVWEEISRSHANPISDTSSPSFVVRRISDDIYFKLDIDFTGTNMLEVQIDALSGCRCGNSAASCPL